MPKLGLGIVGTGMIANAIADAIPRSKNASLIAVSSRRIETAQAFVTKRPGVTPLHGIDPLLTRADIGAIYIATPTTSKEEIALAAIAAGKHVLVEKPFLDHASLLRITNAAAARGVAFMDATHFVHHPRNAAVRQATAAKIGKPRSLHTAFHVPITDRNNIRFDVKQEPMGAIGDLTWYSMRAIVEYLRPEGRIAKVVTSAERDPGTTTVIRATGLIAFESGETSTFDTGFTASTIVMDLQLVGTTGIIGIDDFVVDWNSSYIFKNPDIQTGYTHRTGMATRKEVTFLPTPAAASQDVTMIDNLATLAASGTPAQRAAYATASLKTQEYLDAIWIAAA
jgi:predicted dehydrogenase